ncbi:MAG: leucine-rich repeat domain-containing protein [Clostridiales bacterium]|nr:leucine-rich repeat domain-containing protein [Clostridiales bacterium]
MGEETDIPNDETEDETDITDGDDESEDDIDDTENVDEPEDGSDSDDASDSGENDDSNVSEIGDEATVDGATYQITSTEKLTVKYMGYEDAAAGVKIPATVKINGTKYKVTAIAAGAFKGNKNITSVTIGKNVKKVGKNAFKNCKNLKTVKIKSEKLTSVGKNVFKGISSNAKIKVPSEKLSKYKKMFKASGFAGKVKSL